MAILWSHREGDVLYQVRAAGSTRRLYTNGVLHSQFNPNCIVTGSVWDLLWLPAYFSATTKIERVLLLGVGGGAVVRQLDELFKPAEIIAVDNNPIHLRVSTEYFGITSRMATFKLIDASDFVQYYSGERFNLIIDDLFSTQGGNPCRSLACNHHWIRQLVRHLQEDGILCVNFADRKEYLNAPFSDWRGEGRRFTSAFELTCPRTENVIAALLPWRTDSSALRANLSATPSLARFLRAGPLCYRARPMI